MEFLQRHLPRVYQAVQDALNFFTNVTAQIFGAPPNAPQPRDARTNVPIQTPKESEGSPAPEETRANKETSLLTSPPELSRATEENGESGRDRPGDVDYGTREADLRHRKGDPGGRRDLEYNITEGGDIVLHTTEEVTTQSCVIESTEWKNTATIPHDSQSLLNREEVNPPDHPEPKKEIQKSLTACEIKVSQYEEELPPGTENLANNEPLRSSEHKAYKDEEPIGEPSSGGQYDENLFQSAELKSWGQVAAITDQEGKTKRLIEISTESEEYIMNTEREARVLVESTGSTVTPEYDVDNILDVIDINKKLVTPVDETESSPYPQGGDSQKTWEDLLETANRLAKHYDYAVEDQKGSGNLPDIGKTPGSIPVLVLSKGQDLTSVDDSLAMDSFVIERKGQEVETVKAKSRLLEQSVFSGESNNGSSEEEKDMSIRDVDVPRDTTDKENVQRMREHTAEGIEQRHKSKETESQPNISKTQRTKRRVHFSPSTEDFFKKSERVSRKTLQEVCDDILEGEGQPSGEDAEQFGRSYKIEDWGPEEGDRDHHGGTTFSHDEGQSLKEEGEGDNHGGTSYSHNEGLSPKEEGEGDHHRGTSYSHNDGQSLKKEREGNHHGGTSYSHNEGQSLKEEGEGDHHVGISCSHDEGQSPKEEGEGDHHRGTSYSHNEGQSLKEEGEGDHHGGTSCSHDEGQSTSEKEQADVIDEGRAVWYDEDRAQAEHNERCESLGDVTYQGEFKMAESLLAVMDSKSTEEHLDHILSCEEMPLGETESAGNMDASKSKNIICELSVENKNESYASQETINNSEKESQTASDGKEENASEEDSLLQEAKGKEDHLLEERGDILELGTAYEDDFNQSIATLDPKDDGPPKDFMDEQEQVQNLLLEPGIPADDTNEKQLEIISNYSAHKDTIEFTSDELSLQETDKSIKSDQDGTKVQEDFLKSFQEEVAPSIVQLEEHTLLRQPASRNSDDEVPENKYESQLSTSVEDTCISVVENVISRDVLESEEHKEVLRDAHYQGEDEPFNQTHTHKVEEQINENYDYKHEGMRIKTTSRSESQDEDSKVKIGHIKEELLTEQQCVAQEQYVAGNEVSPTEGLINKQMQDVELPGQLVPTHGSEECPEESYETEQSASQNEVCTSIVQDVLIREGLGSEEYSGIFKDANFEAQSESLNETTTCKVKGHTGVKQNNGYTPHDAIQVDTRESQEEDSKIKTGHTKDECLNGEQFEAEEQLAVHGEESAVELSSNGQFEAEEQLAVHSEESTTELSSIDLFKIEEQLAVHGEESAIELSINDQFEAEEQLTVHVEESAVELSSIDQFEAVEQLAVHSEESAVELFSNDQFEAEEQLAVQSEESTIELSSNDQFEVEEQLAAHDEESTIELSSNDQFEVEEQLAVHDEESTIDISCKAQFEVEEQLEVHSEESTTEVSSNGQFEVERQLANHGEESTIELSSNDQCEVEEQLSRHSDESITELLSNDQFEAEEQLAVHGEESTIELSSNNQFEAEEQLAVHSEETTIELSSNDQFEAEEQLAVHSEESTIESSSNDQFEAKEQLAVHGEESAVELSSIDQFEAEEQLAVHSEESAVELFSNDQFEAEEQLAVQSEESTIELSSNDQFEVEEQLAAHDEESTIELSSNDQFEVEEQLAVHDEESTIDISCKAQFEVEEQLEVYSEESTTEVSSNGQFEVERQLANHGEESTIELSSNDQCEVEEQLSRHSDESITELLSNDQFEAEEQLAVHGEESTIELSSNNQFEAEEQLAVHSEETTIELSSNDQFEAEEQLAVHSEESTIESSSNDQFEAKEQLAVHGEESAVELSSNDQFEAEEQLAVHGEESTIELSSNNQFEAEEQLAVNSEETTIELSSNDQFEAEEQLAVQSEESTIEVSSNDQFEVEEQLAVHSEESTIESSSSDQFEAKEQLVVHSEESTIESSSNDQFEAKEQLAVHGEESAVELSSNGQFEAEEQLAVHSDESAVELSSNDQFEAEEQLAVHSEESAIELSSNDRLQEDRLRGQPVIRDSDKVGYRELNETEQSTSLVEMCTSIVEDMRKREDGASKEMNFETESESAKEIITYEVLEPMTLNQNDDYTHDHSQPDAKELHEEDIEVNIGHIEVTFLTQEQVVYTSEIIPAEGLENEQTQEDMSLRQPVPGENDEVCPENLAEEQLVAEEQLKDLNQASLIEGSSIDQPQEHGLLQTVSIQSVELKNEELYGTEQSASIVKICSSMVDDILRETLGSEELSGSITNTNFKADSESNYESAAHDDYTHEDFQPVTNVSQDEESATHDVQEHPAVKINNDYTHGDFQPETNKSQEGESTTRDVQEHPAVKINDYTHGDFQPETNESQEGESATRDVQEHSAVKINNDYTCEDFKPETNESQDKINNSKACHTDIGLLPEEQFVVTDETCQVEGSSNDQQQEDRISEEHNEDFTDINLKRGSKSDSNMFTCEVEEHTAEEQIDNYSYETFHIETNEPQEDYNKANIGSIEVEPKEQMVVEEQLVLKNEASPKDETGDHTEENTNDTYIKDSEEPQLEQYYLKLIKEGYEERESYQQVTDAAQYADTGHTNILETTTEKEDQLDSGSEIHSIIYSSLLDQSVSMSSEGPVDGLDRASMAQNSDNEMGSELYPSHTAASNVDTVVEVTKIADLDVEKVPLFHEEQDLLSEIQCLLSPDHTIHRFPEIMADLDSNGKVTVPLEDQSGAYIEENAPENTKDLNSPLGSHLEGQSDNKDMNWRSTSHSDDVTNRDILLEIQSVVTTEHTTNFVTGVNLESDVRVEEGVGEKAEAESYLTLGHSVPEEYITLETFMEEEQVNNEQKVTSIEPPGFTHEPSQVQSEVNQQDLDFGTLVINTGLLHEVANLGSIRTSAEGELSLTSELCEAEIDIESLTEPANIQQEVDIAREVQSSTNEETTKIYLNDVGHENIEYGIKEENLPIIQTSRYEDIMRDQWQLLNDEMGMSNERAVQEEDDKGMSKEQAMQEEDDKGMSNEQAMQEEDDKGMSNERVVQEEDDKGMSNERVVQEEDDKGMSNERAVQEQDDKGMSNEQAVQEEDDKGMSNERVVQEEDDKGMSNERAVQEEDDKGMSNERAVQEEDDKEVSNEQAVQEEDDKEMSNERAVQGEDDKGMSNERVVQEQDGKGMFNERAVQEEDDKEMSIERAVQEQDDKEMSNEPVVQEEDDKGRSNERAVQEEDDKGMSNERAVQEEDDKGMSNERSVQEEDDKGMSNERTVQEEDDEGMSNEQAVQEEDGKGMSNERAVQEEDDKGMSNERAVQEGDDKGMSNERVIKEEDDKGMSNEQAVQEDDNGRSNERVVKEEDGKGMSNERAVQEEDELDSKVPFHGTLDVSAQKSRILLLRKTSVRRRPGQRPVTFQDELPDPSPPAIPPQNMGVPVFSALPPAVPSAVETLYPAEEPMEANDAPEPIFRRKSTIRRRGPRPVTFQEELTEPLMPGITSASTEEPKDDGTTSEQISSRESLIPPHQGQIPVTFEGKPVEPSPPVIKPLKMGVPDFIGGMPMLSPAVIPDPETSYAAEEPRDEGTTSEPLLRRKSSIRRPKGKQSVKSEDKLVEPPGSVRMGVPLLPGVPEHVTPAPASSQPVEEPKEEKSASEELAIKPKKGFLKHAGFGGAHPGMMQELQARLHKKKPKE